MSEAKQLNPSHADHISGYNEKFIDNMFKNEFVIAQPKFDGERMLIHIDHDNVYCTSRRFSKKTGRYMENQDKLPFLNMLTHNLNLDYTVLDCECYSTDWSTIVGILHSLPERALELQKTSQVRFAVFDCLYYNGHDMRDSSYLERLKYVLKVVDSINYEPLHLIPIFKDSHDEVVKIESFSTWQRLMDLSVETGYEGIVLRSLQRKYYDKAALLKCKKFETLDVVVIDYQQGRGKYVGTVGALVVGYYDKCTDTFVRLSNVNCGTDEERDFWFNNWNDLKYSVIEVKCQEITEKSLRHPVYIRRREDKDYTMCTKDTIFKV